MEDALCVGAGAKGAVFPLKGFDGSFSSFIGECVEDWLICWVFVTCFGCYCREMTFYCYLIGRQADIQLLCLQDVYTSEQHK